MGGSLQSSGTSECPPEARKLLCAKANLLRQLSYSDSRLAAGRMAPPDEDAPAIHARATAGLLASSHHEVERQALVTGLRSVALVGPIPDLPRAFDASEFNWPASALAVHDALRTHIDVLVQSIEARQLLHQRDLAATRNQAEADAAQTITTL